MNNESHKSSSAPGAVQAARSRRRKGEGGIEFSKPRNEYRGHYRDARGERVRLPWCANRRDAEEQQIGRAHV